MKVLICANSVHNAKGMNLAADENMRVAMLLELHGYQVSIQSYSKLDPRYVYLDDWSGYDAVITFPPAGNVFGGKLGAYQKYWLLQFATYEGPVYLLSNDCVRIPIHFGKFMQKRGPESCEKAGIDWQTVQLAAEQTMSGGLSVSPNLAQMMQPVESEFPELTDLSLWQYFPYLEFTALQYDTGRMLSSADWSDFEFICGYAGAYKKDRSDSLKRLWANSPWPVATFGKQVLKGKDIPLQWKDQTQSMLPVEEVITTYAERCASTYMISTPEQVGVRTPRLYEGLCTTVCFIDKQADPEYSWIERPDLRRWLYQPMVKTVTEVRRCDILELQKLEFERLKQAALNEVNKVEFEL